MIDLTELCLCKILDMSERIKEHAVEGELGFRNLQQIDRFHTLCMYP